MPDYEKTEVFGVYGTIYDYKTGGSYPTIFNELHKTYREASNHLISLGFTPYVTTNSQEKKSDVSFCLNKLDNGVTLELQIMNLLTP